MFFASESNSYPLFYHQSPCCTKAILDNNNTFFHPHHHHHHGEYNNNYLLQPIYPSISENPIVTLSSETSIDQENAINYPSNLINPMSSTRRSTRKKDRHTKICTAQGIRDRRVRLSMSIAREFFNLQDMLGFDKASKTLGWLLAKSKAAIDELASTSNNNIVTPIEDLNEDDDEYVDDENGLNGNSSSKKRKRREVNHLQDQNLAEQFRREMARERARERTRKKKFIVDDHKNHNHHHHQQHQLESLDHHHQIHQRVQQNSMICESSSAATPNSTPTISNGVSVGDNIVIKGNKSKSGSSVNYNYEMMSSKDDEESGNYYNDYFNKSASENCSYGGIMQQPGLFPALDIINLSTEIHINARAWDTYSNQILH